MDQDLQSIQDVRDRLHAAKAAQEVFASFSQEQVDAVCDAMATAGEREAERLARLAVEETGYGRVESKREKNLLCTRLLWNDIRPLRTVGIVEADETKKVFAVAVPFGVVAGITPVTNPTSTALFKCLIAAKTRNAIVISPHPRAARCTGAAVLVLAQAAVQAGAPPGLLSCLERATMEAINELLHHRLTNVILATGGSGLVRAAYSAGKPAFGVGPGNCPAYVDRSADLRHAVTCLIASQTFDWGTVCASEQALILDRPIEQAALEELVRQGAHICTPEQVRALERIALVGRAMNPEVVGAAPGKLAALAGFEVPAATTVLIAPYTGIGYEHPLSLEVLAPLLACYSAEDWQDGCRKCLELLKLGGMGHSLVIHARDEEVILRFGLEKPASRIMVNAPASQGSVGFATRLDPSMTLGCGSFGGNITADNITARHLMNLKRIAFVNDDFFADRDLPAPQTFYAGRQAARDLRPAAPAASRPVAPAVSAALRREAPRARDAAVAPVMNAAEIRALIARRTKEGCAVAACRTRDCSYCT